MIRHNHPGLFIVIEGLGGSGADETATLTGQALAHDGYRVVSTREPTSGLIGGLIRAQLTNQWIAGPESLQLLFTADRAQHLEQTILPALESGRIVVCERYAYSSIAYGSVEVGDQKWLREINDRFIAPDMTFIVKVNPRICALRLKSMDYSVELYREEKKLAKVWEVYEQLSKEDNVSVVNGERGQHELVHEIHEKILNMLSDSRRKIATGSSLDKQQ